MVPITGMQKGQIMVDPTKLPCRSVFDPKIEVGAG